MTNIEYVKLIVYGNKSAETPINDSDLTDILSNQGVNVCIEILARTQLSIIVQKPTSINDGAVSMSWNDRKSVLEGIIKQAQDGLFVGPEEDLKKPILNASIPI